MASIKELKEICQPHRGKNHPRDFGYLKHRELSVYITWVILKVAGGKIKANHISIFNIFFGGFLLLLVALAGSQGFSILLLLLFYFSFLLDKVDGEIARYQKNITLRGAYLDEIYLRPISGFEDLRHQQYRYDYNLRYKHGYCGMQSKSDIKNHWKILL